MIDFAYLKPPTEAMIAYAQALYARVAEGVVVPRVEVEVDGWKPSPNVCHENVFTWVDKAPGDKAMHGWLYFDFVDMLPMVRFTAHSVIETADHQLIDITPTPIPRQYPFIRASIPEDEFGQMVIDLTACYGAAHLDHWK
jgi:hypothetical protein